MRRLQQWDPPGDLQGGCQAAWKLPAVSRLPPAGKVSHRFIEVAVSPQPWRFPRLGMSRR